VTQVLGVELACSF